MSDLIVDVCRINEIKVHPNADKMEIAVIKGWEVCIVKDSMKQGDIVVYIPPDSMLPIELSNRLGVTKYLSKGCRVRSIKLRGNPSHGFAISISDLPELKSYKVGDNVAEVLNIKKYEPQIGSKLKSQQGFVLKDHPRFHKYTDIQNYRHFPDLIPDDEIVVVTEKIHGSCGREGLIENKWMAGSHNLRRKPPWHYESILSKIKFYLLEKLFHVVVRHDLDNSMYWYPLEDIRLKNMIKHIYKEKKAKAVIVFNEIYGNGIQDLIYGHMPGEKSYIVFDISVDGKYLDWDETVDFCALFHVPIVPVITTKTMGDIRKMGLNLFADGQTLIKYMGVPVEQIREGIVIKPVKEKFNSKIGRMILKYISDDYLTRKDGTENH